MSDAGSRKTEPALGEGMRKKTHNPSLCADMRGGLKVSALKTN